MLAVLYDIHGNLPALEAVLGDARAQGARRFLLGGDYAVFGGWPAETIARLKELDAAWVRGNVDRWLREGAPEGEPATSGVASAREELGPELVEELGTLPETLLRGGDRFCHASPASDMRSFFPEPGDDEADLLAGVSEPRVVFGHTHLAFRRISAHGGIELLNPGSVGIPLDGDHRAAYALIADDRRVEQRRVAYDHAASAARIRERFGGRPWAEIIAGQIDRARAD